MSKINGTDVLLYADGTLIAAQRNCTVNWDQELPDASSKDSSGWAEHINGKRTGSVDFDALYSTTGLSGDELVAYITGRTSLVVVGEGLGVSFVGEADVSSFSMDTPTEDAVSISGSLPFTGGLWFLTGDYEELITSWTNSGSNPYESFSSTGIAIDAANSSATGQCSSSGFSVTTGDLIKVYLFLTLNSGQLPDLYITESGVGGVKSNQETLVEGVNMVNLTATDTITGALTFQNSGAADFETSDIYVFKA